MTATFTLTGRVLDKSKRPVVGVSVIVVPLAGVTRDPSVNEVYAATVRAVTDANGRLVVPGSTDPGVPLVGGEQYLVRSTLNSVLRPVTFTGPTSGTLDLADIEPEPIDLPNTWHDTIDDLVSRIVALEAGGGGGGAASLSVASMEFYGHSYTSGSGAHTATYRYASRLCRALGALEVNFGNAGTKLIDEGRGAGAGGWTWVGINRVPTPRAVGHEYDAPAQVISIDYGVNEFIGGTAPNMAQLAHAFRATIHNCRAAQRFSNNDAPLSYTGGFTGLTDYADAQVGKTLRGSASGGAKVTFAIPDTFPGGNAGMTFTGALGRGARLTFTVDGADAGSLDMRNTHPVNGRFGTSAKRFTGLSAGAHTIVATVDGSVSPADVFFDTASIEATTPPLIVVHNIARTPQYGGNGEFNTPNATIAAVVAEFDESVVLLDTNTVLGNGDPFNFNPDNLHPSDAGHAAIASALYDVIVANAERIPGVEAVLVG